MSERDESNGDSKQLNIDSTSSNDVKNFENNLSLPISTGNVLQSDNSASMPYGSHFRMINATRNCNHLQVLNPQQYLPTVQETSPPTLPPVAEYSDLEASQLFEKIKSKDHSEVIKAIHTLLFWMEHDKCTKENANKFFQLLMSLGRCSMRLFNDKKNLIKGLGDAKTQMKHSETFIDLCLKDVENLFETAQNSKKFMSNLSKSDRKYIQVMAARNLVATKNYSGELFNEKLSQPSCSTENPETISPKPVKVKKNISKEELNQLRLENFRVKERYAQVLAENEKIKKRREDRQEAYKKDYQELQNRIAAQKEEIAELEAFKESYLAQTQNESQSDQVQEDSDTDVSEHETLIVSLVAAFLNVHPFGAEIDGICSYLKKRVDANINRTDVQTILRKFPYLFEEKVDNSLLKRWKFLGLQK